MKAYNCDKLLFTCWSMTSMTVFLARFDSELWNVCWSELVKVYGSEHPKRPTRFSEVSNRLRPLVKDYVEKNVEFLGEFPSCQAQSEESKDVADVHTDYPYVKPEATDRTIQTYMISDLQDCLVSAKKWVESAYYYSRTVATEILVYMLNYENFFSTFRDMDPTGQGTPKPDAIPDMMSSAAELDLIRLDHDRGFYMKTSKAEVYPRKEYESMDFDSVDCPDDVDPIDLYHWKQTSPTVTRKPLNLVGYKSHGHVILMGPETMKRC